MTDMCSRIEEGENNGKRVDFCKLAERDEKNRVICPYECNYGLVLVGGILRYGCSRRGIQVEKYSMYH